jgi:hypothetical protein
MDKADTTDTFPTRRLRPAVIAGGTLVILIAVAVSIYVGAFVILSPRGDHANATMPVLIMV